MLPIKLTAFTLALASLLAGGVASAAEPALREDPPQKSVGLYSAGAVASFAGFVGLGVVVVDNLTFGSLKPEPALTHDQSLPLLWGSLGVVGAGTAMVLVGRERDYGVEVPRRSPVVTGIGVGAITVGAAMLGSTTAFAGTDRSGYEIPAGSQEIWNSSFLNTMLTFWGAALFGGGYAMVLIGSAQAPQKAAIPATRTKTQSLRLELPTLSVAPLYSQRERSMYGAQQGTEVQLGLVRGSF